MKKVGLASAAELFEAARRHEDTEERVKDGDCHWG
jgi:hypothetical protein